MKKVLFLMILLFLIVSGTATTNAQVKIGENAIPRKGAVLDLNGSYKGGLLLPNVEITDMGKIPEDFHDTSVRGKDEVLELTGLIVWNTGTGSEGVYVWDGKDWQMVSGGTAPPQNCTVPAAPASIEFDKTTIKVGETINAICGVVTDATSYVWTLPDGLTPRTAETITNELVITGNKDQIYGAGTVQVSTRNACGTSVDAGSNKDAVTVQQQSLGNQILGRSTACTYAQKEQCTCASGTPVFFADANSSQRSSARTYFQGPPYWFVNARNGDVYGCAYLSQNWSQGELTMASTACAACF